jgi:hypothetical protein
MVDRARGEGEAMWWNMQGGSRRDGSESELLCDLPLQAGPATRVSYPEPDRSRERRAED